MTAQSDGIVMGINSHINTIIAKAIYLMIAKFTFITSALNEVMSNTRH